MKTVVTIITSGDKILIGKLKSEMLPNYGGIEYVFPGGKIEENENEEAAAVREAHEETSLLVRVVARIGERLHPKTGREMVYYHAEVMGGHLSVNDPKNDDISELIWITRKSLSAYMPTLYDKINEYLTTLQ
jgi:8-oxo-dGTP diphosphatase